MLVANRIGNSPRERRGGDGNGPRTKEYKSLVVCLYQDFRQSFQAFLIELLDHFAFPQRKHYQPIASSNGSWSVVVSWLNDVLFTGPEHADVHATPSRLLSPTPPQPPKSTQLLLRISIHHSHPHQALLQLLVDLRLQWYLLALFLASPDLRPRSCRRGRLSRSNGEVTAGYER